MSVKDSVIKFIKNLNDSERGKLETMVKHGITCCVGYAKDLNIDTEDFNAELRRIFK